MSSNRWCISAHWGQIVGHEARCFRTRFKLLPGHCAPGNVDVINKPDKETQREAMSAYVIAMIDVTDPEGYEMYKDMVPITIAQYGGRYLARGGRSDVLEGETASNRFVVLEFESFERAQEWWSSSEYEAVKPHRTKNATSSIVLVEGLP